MKQQALISEDVIVTVPFHDVDVMEVAWHGHYVKYFEIARTALTQKLGYDYPQMRDSGFAWPIVSLSIKYAKPAQYGQSLRVVAELMEWEMRMLIRYTIYDAETDERLTKAETSQVAVNIQTREMHLGTVPELKLALKQCGALAQ